MKIQEFAKALNIDFFTGVPDSLLKPLYDYLLTKYDTDPKHHIIAANEGNAVALAAGYYMSTGKIPAVYLQNSGEGNIINPVTSLLNEKVYGIPVIFIIGWRGEPGVHDEPQHIFQGEITTKLLDDLGIAYCVIDNITKKNDVTVFLNDSKQALKEGKSIAFVVCKNALESDEKKEYLNNYFLRREEIIDTIVSFSGNDPIVSTTGKASRELFEIREKNQEGHDKDFLTVGSMGHSSSIALEIACQKPQNRIWCIDGDGAVLMHMGAMAIIGAYAPEKLIHIVINNCAHESVGGAPTAASKINLTNIAKSCGYKKCYCIKTLEELKKVLETTVAENGLTFIEVKAAIGSRADLGRPTTSTHDNIASFMIHLDSLN